MGQIGSPVSRSSAYSHDCFVAWKTPLIGPAVHDDVHEERRGRRVVVPDVVVHELEVPAALARLHVERDDARAEEVVAGVEAAVVVDRGAVRDEVDESEFGVRRERRPRGHVTRPLPGVVLPRLVPELARPRDDVELPLELAGARVIGQDVARDHLLAGLVVTLLRGVADDDHVVHDDRRGRRRDVADLERHPLIRVVLLVQALPRLPALDEVRHQVHRPRGRESRQRHRLAPVVERPPRLGVERVEEERGTDDVDDPATIDLGVGDALAVRLPHRVLVPPGHGFGEAPQEPSRGGVEGDDMPVLARDRHQLPVDVGRGGPRRARPEARSVPAPRDLEALEIGGIDLRRRRVAGVPGVAPVVGPRGSLHARALRRNGRTRDGSEEKGEKKGAARSPAPVVLHHPSALAVLSSAVRRPGYGKDNTPSWTRVSRDATSPCTRATFLRNVSVD